MFICFFIGNPLSPYFSSDLFTGVVQKISPPFELKQTDGKLKMVAKGVDSLAKAHSLLLRLR